MERHPRFLPLAAALVATTASLAHAADPQLGKSPDKDVIAAMTKEEKAALVTGTGMRMPGQPPAQQPPAPKGPRWGDAAVPGAAGTPSRSPAQDLAVIVADGPACGFSRSGADSTKTTTAPHSRMDAQLLAGRRLRRARRPLAMGNGEGVRRRRVLAPALNTHRNPRRPLRVLLRTRGLGQAGGGHDPGVSQGVGTSAKHFVATTTSGTGDRRQGRPGSARDTCAASRS